MGDIDADLLEGVLRKTEAIVAATGPGDVSRPTPCEDYDVADLTSHIVGWIQTFAAGIQQQPPTIDPMTYRAGDDAATVFRKAADEALAGWRSGAAEHDITLVQGAMPGPMAFNLMLGEYVVHGWDLAVATDQPVRFTDAEAQRALDGLLPMLKPEYRGEAFGAEVEVADDAPPLDRLVAFSGRRPF
jgi:uncharacterized protein (TIGR03086 family)